MLVGIFWTNYEHFSNVQVLTFLECSYLMSYECSILIGMSCTKNEHWGGGGGCAYLRMLNQANTVLL